MATRAIIDGLHVQSQEALDQAFPLSVTLVMRWFVLLGLLLRLQLTLSEYSFSVCVASTVTIACYVTYVVVLTIAALRQPRLLSLHACTIGQIVIETLLFSVAYTLTGKLDSDVSLFFFLPLIVAADGLPTGMVRVAFGLITTAYLGSAIALATSLNESSIIRALVRNVAPRWIFFLFVLFLAVVRGKLLQQRTSELEVVRETAARIAANEEFDLRVREVMTATCSLLRANGCKLYLRVPQEDFLELRGIVGIDPDLMKPGYRLPVGAGVAGTAFARTMTVIANDYATSPFRVAGLAGIFNAVAATPLMFGHDPIGVLSVLADGKRRRFGKGDLPVLERLAQHVAVAIHDIQLFEEVERRTNALATMNAAASAMTTDVEPAEVARRLVRYAWDLVGLYSAGPPIFACVRLLSADGTLLELAATQPTSALDVLQKHIGAIDMTKASVGVVGLAVRRREPLLIPDVRAEPAYLSYNTETRCQFAIPIMQADNVLGVLNVEHAHPQGLPRRLEAHLVMLARQAAAALHNVSLFAEVKRGRGRAERLRDAGVAMNAALDAPTVGRHILHSLQELVPFARGTVQVFTDGARIILAQLGLSSNDIDPALLQPVHQDPLIARLLRDRNVLILSPPEADSDWNAHRTTKDIRTWIGIPLFAAEHAIGLVTLDQLTDWKHDEDTKTLLELFAVQAGSILHNVLLLEERARRVDELTTAQTQLETLVQQMEDHRNLALIGLVYGETIHFARNLLGSAKVFAHAISSGSRSGWASDDARSLAARITTNLDKYLGVLTKTQEAALQAPDCITFDLTRMLERLISAKRIPTGIEVSCEWERGLWMSAPETQVRQVFFVLVQNAFNAMSGRIGKLVLGARTRQVGDRSMIDASVSDTGIGIDPGRTVFEPRLHGESGDVGKGTGLGLAWARAFMRSYGGDITFESRHHGGTTFTVLLPVEFRLGTPVITIAASSDVPHGSPD